MDYIYILSVHYTAGEGFILLYSDNPCSQNTSALIILGLMALAHSPFCSPLTSNGYQWLLHADSDTEKEPSAFSVTVINFPWCVSYIHLLLHFPSLTVIKSCLEMVMWNMNKHFFSSKSVMLSIYHFQPHQTLYRIPVKDKSKNVTFYLLAVNDHSIQKPTVFFNWLLIF